MSFLTGHVPVTLTSYWPWDVHNPGEAEMEGPPTDRKGHRLHTLEEHQEDPVAHPYCAVAGDYRLWRYGQRVQIAAIDPNAVFRVVDTGGDFYGPHKRIRFIGHEPLDICVQTRLDSIGPVMASALVIDGDVL